jgi:hypothetical protein
MHWLDHVFAEPKSGIQYEQISEVFGGPQVTSCMDTNIAFEQGKPPCIPLIILDFSFNHYLYVKFNCALGLYELSDTIDALWLPSWLSLIILLAILRH